MGTASNGNRCPSNTYRGPGVLLFEPDNVDKKFWDGDWVDLYDSNHKLWKSIAYFNDIGQVPGLGRTWDGVASMAWDLQNTHMTVFRVW
jgi:hypothetical protein